MENVVEFWGLACSSSPAHVTRHFLLLRRASRTAMAVLATLNEPRISLLVLRYMLSNANQ